MDCVTIHQTPTVREWPTLTALQGELRKLVNITVARKIPMDGDNQFRQFVAMADGHFCEISQNLAFALRQEMFHFSRGWPARKAGDDHCARCHLVDARTSGLSLAGAFELSDNRTLCRSCELAIGVNLRDWPRCEECRYPFVNFTAGQRGHGYWVDRIADNEDLCGCCWLDEHYEGDHSRMVEHTITTDTIRLATGAVRVAFELNKRGVEILDLACTWLSSGAGLFELLRLERVTIAEAAATIRRLALAICKNSPSRPAAEKRRAAMWRAEQFDPKLKLSAAVKPKRTEAVVEHEGAGA